MRLAATATQATSCAASRKATKALPDFACAAIPSLRPSPEDYRACQKGRSRNDAKNAEREGRSPIAVAAIAHSLFTGDIRTLRLHHCSIGRYVRYRTYERLVQAAGSLGLCLI